MFDDTLCFITLLIYEYKMKGLIRKKAFLIVSYLICVETLYVLTSLKGTITCFFGGFKHCSRLFKASALIFVAFNFSITATLRSSWSYPRDLHMFSGTSLCDNI